MGVCKTSECVLSFDPVRERSTPFLNCLCSYLFLWAWPLCSIYLILCEYTECENSKCKVCFWRALGWFSVGKTTIRPLLKENEGFLADVLSKPTSLRPLKNSLSVKTSSLGLKVYTESRERAPGEKV